MPTSSGLAISTVGDESCGQVALDVSASAHPGSGEREGHIRGGPEVDVDIWCAEPMM